MAKITKCAKCGACTTPCPVYKITGKETLAARGRIHLLTKLGTNEHSQNYNEIFSKCLLCGACYQACPRDINTPELIVDARENGAKIGGFANFKKLLIQKSLSSPSLLPQAAAYLPTIKKVADKLLPVSSGLRTKLALFESDPYHQKTGFIKSLQGIQEEGYTKKAAYFPGCLANYLMQDIGAATVNCLKQICATDTIAPPEQSCCGMAAYASGNMQEALHLATKNILAFSSPPYADLPIVTSCATCYAHLRSYRELFKDDKEWQQKAESFADRVCEFSSFLLTNISSEFQFKGQRDNQRNVFYHDPCHLRFPKKNEKPIVNEPRQLLAKIQGLTLNELEDGPQCCGQGGLFNICHPDDSQAICSSLLAGLFKTEAEVVLTTCSGCLIHIREGLSQKKSALKAEHLSLFLNEYLDPPDRLS